MEKGIRLAQEQASFSFQLKGRKGKWRCYRQQIEIPVDTQLHVFTDASELGFSAVAYLRFVYADDGVEVAFLMTKTHVAPVKKRTIPELELRGCVRRSRPRESHRGRVTTRLSQSYFPYRLQDGHTVDQFKDMQVYRLCW